MLFNFNNNGGDMNALEMALEALTNPSTIAVSHAVELIKAELAKSKQNKPLRLSPMYEYGHIHDASQPEQDHGFDRTASHMTGEYVDTAQPEQESISTNDHLCAMLRHVHDVLACTALPMKRKWVGLTDDEIEKIVDLNTSDDGGFDIWCDGIAVAHIVCAKLKEKNA